MALFPIRGMISLRQPDHCPNWGNEQLSDLNVQY
jgi:hypothetical protein